MLTDLGVLLADGGQRISDIDVLGDQGELFGAVASDSTLWRALHEIDGPALTRIETARPRSTCTPTRRAPARGSRRAMASTR